MDLDKFADSHILITFNLESIIDRRLVNETQTIEMTSKVFSVTHTQTHTSSYVARQVNKYIYFWIKNQLTACFLTHCRPSARSGILNMFELCKRCTRARVTENGWNGNHRMSGERREREMWHGRWSIHADDDDDTVYNQTLARLIVLTVNPNKDNNNNINLFMSCVVNGK